MGFKVRGYDKNVEQEKTRDYSLFAIACEGTEREPEYFRPFSMIDRIKVDIIENRIGKRDSAPKKVLERVQRYIEEVGLSEKIMILCGVLLMLIIGQENRLKNLQSIVIIFQTGIL